MSLFNFIKTHLSIVDVVREYVSLRQAGNYWKGPCPFHQETDASFTVSPDKGIFYCFGCHLGGDVIAFIAKQENISQIQAAHQIVERYKLTIPADLMTDFKGKQEPDKKRSFHHLCQTVALWTQERLLESAEAMTYLEGRGISRKEIEYFGIGYFPSGSRWMDRFITSMAEQAILVKDLLEMGIVGQARSALYSPFEERILFPIKDALGNYCGFGGRIYKQGDQRPKYYNSKDSSIFNKGHLLFGLDVAKKEMQYQAKAFLVEGYIDCVVMAKHGYKTTVATLGTACTLEHLKLLARYIKQLYVIYDGDAAGQKAILRLTGLCWGANLDLKVVTLPHQDDPASFLYKGGDLDALIKNAKDIFSFYVESVGSGYMSKTLIDKLEFAHKIVELIAHLDDTFKQDLLLQEASRVMQVPFDSLKKLLKRTLLKEWQVLEESKALPASVKTPDESKKTSLSLDEKIVIGIINTLSLPSTLTLDEQLIPYFAQNLQEILSAFNKVRSVPSAEKFQALLECLSEEQRKWVIQKCMEYEAPSLHELEELVSRFKKHQWKYVVRDIKAAILRAKQSRDTEKLHTLLEEFIRLKEDMQGKGLV